MSKNITPIVVVAFNRPRSLARLLNSLSAASYPDKNIELIISIDNSDDNQEVLNIANSFDWVFGKKIVTYQKVNLGLRAHILKCGDLTSEYGSVIVLEDDIFVSPNFYFFAKAALNFSENENPIGGISLYNHQLNVHTKENFSPVEDGFDNWYFQFASSWGQAWTKKQWNGFKNWYLENQSLAENRDIPQNVNSWSEKSWLKFYIAYLIDTNGYFLYPKISMSTNFSDAGTHIGHDTTIYQVPLNYGTKKEFNFSSVQMSQSVYDAFFENLGIPKYLGYSKDELCIDLYGYKDKCAKRYWLTTKILNFKIIKSFSRSLKPIDANIIKNIVGNDIFLYDTTVTEKNRIRPDFYRGSIYKLKYVSFNDSRRLFLDNLKMKTTRVFNKIINQE
ncbi:MAG: glycosyltransferase family 2 protein [Maribacter sp.]